MKPWEKLLLRVLKILAIVILGVLISAYGGSLIFSNNQSEGLIFCAVIYLTAVVCYYASKIIDVLQDIRDKDK